MMFLFIIPELIISLSPSFLPAAPTDCNYIAYINIYIYSIYTLAKRSSNSIVSALETINIGPSISFLVFLAVYRARSILSLFPETVTHSRAFSIDSYTLYTYILVCICPVNLQFALSRLSLPIYTYIYVYIHM